MSLLINADHIKTIVGRAVGWTPAPTGPTPSLLMSAPVSSLAITHSAQSIKLSQHPIKAQLTGHTGATMVTYDTSGWSGQGDTCGGAPGTQNNLAAWLSNAVAALTGNG